MIKLDLHTHSWFSFDSMNDPEAIAKAAADNALDGFAITDHNVFEVDFPALQEKFPGLIIVPGTEIWTEIGDILIYFPKRAINSHDAVEVLQQAKEQNALSVLAHPWSRHQGEYPVDLLQLLDGIETNNAHNAINHKRCQELATELGKPCFGGSDGHFVSEIGNGWTNIDIEPAAARDQLELREAMLKSSTSESKPCPSWSFIGSQSIKYAKRFKIIKSKQ